jgi:hypothetical protein
MSSDTTVGYVTLLQGTQFLSLNLNGSAFAKASPARKCFASSFFFCGGIYLKLFTNTIYSIWIFFYCVAVPLIKVTVNRFLWPVLHEARCMKRGNVSKARRSKGRRLTHLVQPHVVLFQCMSR